MLIKYKRFFEDTFFRKENRFNDNSFFTILERKARVGDIIPLFHYKTQRELLCKVVAIQEEDDDNSWRFSSITRSSIDYAIFVTPIRRSKNIYKKYVKKDGDIDWEWRQMNVSNTYYSKSDKDFARMMFGDKN